MHFRRTENQRYFEKIIQTVQLVSCFIVVDFHQSLKSSWMLCIVKEHQKLLELVHFRSNHLERLEEIVHSHFKCSSRHWRCSIKKGIPKNFANFTGKHMYWSLSLTLKEIPIQVFSCEIWEIFKNTWVRLFLELAVGTSKKQRQTLSCRLC